MAGKSNLAGGLFSRALLLLLASQLGAQYVGKEACRGCHPQQASSHSGTGHARALGSGADKADWAFGSGTHAITWVKQLDAAQYLELGRSWFRASGGLGRTPGHRDDNGVKYALFEPEAKILRCFSCHSTGVPKVSTGGRIEPAEAGVNCEVCHGPGKEHVESGGSKYRIENPIRYRASAINTLCGNCHRQPEGEGGSPKWQDPWNARHQPIYLAESRCFQESNEKLSCFSCHAPHEKLSTGKAKYDAVCSSCHREVKHSRNVAKTSCTTCHMPQVKPSPDLGFSNHWIGIYATGQTLRPKR